ncbi:MAG: ABC-2 family transporter protein, partial [Planctomycetota bacterium]|nr:ABC-2 family transporter protein [Planctomycetota bacterium]
ATLAFWTTESLEVMNAFTFGGVETAQFPLSIYPGWMRALFLFVIPLGCVTYLPVAVVLGKELPMEISPALGVLAPLAAFAFLALTILIFMLGVLHYASTGN